MSENSVHLCRDCRHPMAVRYQSDGRGGYITLLTCCYPLCLLNAVTLSVDQYVQLTESQLKAYRKMNRTSRAKYMDAS